MLKLLNMMKLLKLLNLLKRLKLLNMLKLLKLLNMLNLLKLLNMLKLLKLLKLLKPLPSPWSSSCSATGKDCRRRLSPLQTRTENVSRDSKLRPNSKENRNDRLRTCRTLIQLFRNYSIQNHMFRMKIPVRDLTLRIWVQLLWNLLARNNLVQNR